MKKALISIKPIYAEKIRSGIKKWEFRKLEIKDYNEIYVYESNPVKKITLKLKISEVIKDNPKYLWQLTKTESGLTKKEFDKYFADKDKGYAYRIESFKTVNIDINNLKIPQTVIYIEEDNIISEKD